MNQKASKQKSSSTHSGWKYQSAGFSDGSERRRQPQCFDFLLRVPQQSSARNKPCWGRVRCCVVNVLSNFKIFLCRLFSCFALFCPHPTFHYMQLCHRYFRPIWGCPRSPIDMACSRPHIGLGRAAVHFAETLSTPRTLKYGRKGWTQKERQSQGQ
jgi:hypothetical protein